MSGQTETTPIHVLWRLPHFPASATTLEEILNFIRINFYTDYRYRLVGHRIGVLI